MSDIDIPAGSGQADNDVSATLRMAVEREEAAAIRQAALQAATNQILAVGFARLAGYPQPLPAQALAAVQKAVGTGQAATAMPKAFGPALQREVPAIGGPTAPTAGTVLGTALTAAVSPFVAKLMLFLAPVVAFSTVLGAATSGMETFAKAVSLMGTTLAPILLPGVLALAAGVVALSDGLWETILPGLGQWFKMVYDAAAKWVKKIGDIIQWVWEKVSGQKMALGGGEQPPVKPEREWREKPGGGWDQGPWRVPKWDGGVRGGPGGPGPRAMPNEPPKGETPDSGDWEDKGEHWEWARKRRGERGWFDRLGDWERGRGQRANAGVAAGGGPVAQPAGLFGAMGGFPNGLPAIPPPRPGERWKLDPPKPQAAVPGLAAPPAAAPRSLGDLFAQRFAKAFGEVFEDFKASNQKRPAQFSGLVDFNKQVQTAALNGGSPLDAKMERRFQDLMAAIERYLPRIVENTGKPFIERG